TTIEVTNYLVQTKGIEKLTGPENYAIWAKDVRVNLISAGFKTLLEGTLLFPSSGTDEEKEEWEMKDSACQSVILSTITNDVKRNVATTSTAADMWNVLKNAYGITSEWSLPGLTNEYWEVQITDKGALDTIKRLQTIAVKMAEIGSPIPPEHVVARALHCLKGDAYGT
ncbi:unnamed protein product, partial [Allacma fusca]